MVTFNELLKHNGELVSLKYKGQDYELCEIFIENPNTIFFMNNLVSNNNGHPGEYRKKYKYSLLFYKETFNMNVRDIKFLNKVNTYELW